MINEIELQTTKYSNPKDIYCRVVHIPTGLYVEYKATVEEESSVKKAALISLEKKIKKFKEIFKTV